MAIASLRRGICRYCERLVDHNATVCIACAAKHLHDCICDGILTTGRGNRIRPVTGSKPLPNCNRCGGKGWYYD